jgi:hypothetical protein
MGTGDLDSPQFLDVELVFINQKAGLDLLGLWLSQSMGHIPIGVG